MILTYNYTAKFRKIKTHNPGVINLGSECSFNWSIDVGFVKTQDLLPNPLTGASQLQQLKNTMQIQKFMDQLLWKPLRVAECGSWNPEKSMNSKRLYKSTLEEFKGQNYFLNTKTLFSYKTWFAPRVRVQGQLWIKPSVSKETKSQSGIKLLHASHVLYQHVWVRMWWHVCSLPVCICRKTKFKFHKEISSNEAIIFILLILSTWAQLCTIHAKNGNAHSTLGQHWVCAWRQSSKAILTKDNI